MAFSEYMNFKIFQEINLHLNKMAQNLLLIKNYYLLKSQYETLVNL